MASHFPLCGWQASRRASARIRRVVWICISTILMQSASRMKDHERRLLSWRAWRFGAKPDWPLSGHSIRQKYLRPDFNQLPLLPTTSRIALCHREIRKGAALTRGRPDGKALRSASSSAAGPQKPAAGDAGSRSHSEGLPDDSLRSPERYRFLARVSERVVVL